MTFGQSGGAGGVSSTSWEISKISMRFLLGSVEVNEVCMYEMHPGIGQFVFRHVMCRPIPTTIYSYEVEPDT